MRWVKWLAVFGSSIFISGCIGDAQVTVSGSAKKEMSCTFKAYSDGRLVENFPVSGKFREVYAVSIVSDKRIEIVCRGGVVVRRDLSFFSGNINVGELSVVSEN
ncbi:hypothetical protein [Xanthomonas rydalmerensis]|uniref:Lipoprotein n=1 Tax=Xanthomonas rydalmerensis TaxID=3046274 RepID=A0ABZ0JRU9_9XANT|nr:hypothetical protein [Xanthomonas sp. DM-2023]WOS42043.1 hypothetical protein QN243_06230 [Xanthomonas sp. DM-2023]WOS46229.1 hypothetical protein QN242_06230 [Xanthomonas sp. DM-2023]WOS50408.1 hypothetical protein QN240_06230 [Xanthomonas sp. DM-2023]WOS54588.1 hypothetical protein QN244_06230 [Xanthomonas sp. DM-2023]WOS58771.1 hypothetical protein QN245_06230 [Xanthomonas sp. DM-2023]